MRRLRIAAFAAAVALAPVAGLAAPQAAAIRQSGDADLDLWLRKTAAWGQDFRRVQELEVPLVSKVIAGTTTAQRYYTSRDKAGGVQWVAPWASERRAELARLSTAIAGLNAEPPPLPAYAATMPRVAIPMARYRDVGRTSLADLHEATALVSDLVGLIEKTVTGDEPARNAMQLRAIDGSTALIKAEMSSLESSAAAAGERHPEAAILRSSVEADDAILVLLRFRRDRFNGKAAPAETYAAEIRRRADAMDALARRIDPDAAATLKQMHEPGVLASALMERLDRAFATYHDSEALDEVFAGSVRAMAALVAEGDIYNSAKMQAAMADIAANAQKAHDLDVTRSQIIAGQP